MGRPRGKTARRLSSAHRLPLRFASPVAAGATLELGQALRTHRGVRPTHIPGMRAISARNACSFCPYEFSCILAFPMHSGTFVMHFDRDAFKICSIMLNSDAFLTRCIRCGCCIHVAFPLVHSECIRRDAFDCILVHSR